MIVTTLASATPDPRPRPPIRDRRWSSVKVGLLRASILLLIGISQPDIPSPGQASRQPAGMMAVDPRSTSVATLPAEPVAGVLTLSVPPGAAADQRLGGRGYVMPSVISLDIGGTIVIRNDDDAPHMILYPCLMPGETTTRTFTEIGSEVYSSVCGLHAASFLNFTTIFVSESGSGKPDPTVA